MFVSLTTICHISPLCHSFIATLQGTLIAWLPQQHKKMLEQTCITDNEVCNFYHSSRSWKYRDFSSKPRPRPRPRPRLFLQDQDFYFKTKTIFHVLEAPWDQGARSRDYIPASGILMHPAVWPNRRAKNWGLRPLFGEESSNTKSPGWRNVWNTGWRAPDEEVYQKGHGKRLCKKIAKHVIRTSRMLWIVVDGRSW